MYSTDKILTDINNDCLLKFFRYLDVQDMAIASDTCLRFKEIASEAFKYEWYGKPIWLSNETKNNKLESTAILRHFGNLLQKIHVNFGQKWNDYFFELIIEKCDDSKLTELDISSEVITKESICHFKKKFTNLKSLAVENVSNDTVQLKFLEENFPTLESLQLYGCPFENQNVQQFISLNPQLKNLALLYRNDVYNVKSLLEHIDRDLPQLEQLELQWMPRFANEIRYQPRFLKNLKRLKFFNFGTGINMQYLSISNENVQELELEEGTCDGDVTDFISNYKKVKKLAIRNIDYPLDYKDLLKLNENLPYLEALEISSCRRNFNHEDIIRIILGSKQLVTLSIKDDKLDDISVVAKELQKKLDSLKWRVDCSLSNNELIIRKLIGSIDKFKNFIGF